VFGRRAGIAAASSAAGEHRGVPGLAHVDAWRHAREEAGLSDGPPSPVILPDYRRKEASIPI
jgi:hypothetical protein